MPVNEDRQKSLRDIPDRYAAGGLPGQGLGAEDDVLGAPFTYSKKESEDVLRPEVLTGIVEYVHRIEGVRKLQELLDLDGYELRISGRFAVDLDFSSAIAAELAQYNKRLCAELLKLLRNL